MLVTLTVSAEREARKLPRAIRARVLNIVDRLANWPNVSGAKGLSGNLAGCYRIRTGDYRLQFRVAAERIIIEKIGHRDGFYED